MCPDSCANLVRLGVGSPAALAQHMARIQLTQRAVFFLTPLELPMPKWKNRAVPGGEGRGETVGMEQLAPLGDAGGFLTPGRVCSSPDACPHQADRAARCCIRGSENLAERREKWGSLSSRGVFWGRLAGKLHPWFAGVLCGMGFLHSLSMPKKYQGEKVGKMSKKSHFSST